MHIFSSYAKILGEKLICTWGDSPKWVKSKRQRKEEEKIARRTTGAKSFYFCEKNLKKFTSICKHS